MHRPDAAHRSTLRTAGTLARCLGWVDRRQGTISLFRLLLVKTVDEEIRVHQIRRVHEGEGQRGGSLRLVRRPTRAIGAELVPIKLVDCGKPVPVSQVTRVLQKPLESGPAPGCLGGRFGEKRVEGPAR